MRRESLSSTNKLGAWPPHSLEGLDFETFGAVNLPKYGLDRYVSDSSFTPLIASVSSARGTPETFDFIRYPEDTKLFRDHINDTLAWGTWFTAHNVGFERAVLRKMGYPDEVLYRIIDSAVIARAMGAASHLEAAAPQLTGIDKLETGKDLIMTFSVPTDKNQGRPYTWAEIFADPNLRAWWNQFKEYCEVDAAASRSIVQSAWGSPWLQQEHEREWLTYLMNREGWPVDLDMVNDMKLRYEDNCAQITSEFYQFHGTLRDGTPMKDTFLNSTPQMKEWCAERGIKTSSFDAEHIDKLLARIQKKLATMKTSDKWFEEYTDVEELLITKKELGGSSLKKLQTIIDLTGTDKRLRNQYMHLGAGQTYRTTGKGVQMQNLKRLSATPMDFEEDNIEDADNTTLAENLRQVFYAEHLDGLLMVGDFSSVESRGLAWVAGAEWKTQAFREGKDLYKVQAQAIYGIPYENVNKAQRQVGKVGELGCGYGAGPVALSAFAGKMGIEMTETAAGSLVNDWRGSNPEVVDLWKRLQEGLEQAVALNAVIEVPLANGLAVQFITFDAPDSLQKQHPGIRSLKMRMVSRRTGNFIMERVFQGVYQRGSDICFYKPSDRKTGDLWVNHYRDPKTGQIVFYKLYGGKLTGILVQSMCREMFFTSTEELYTRVKDRENVQIIGQFHDELVVRWVPPRNQSSDMALSQLQFEMDTAMSTVAPEFEGFPLVADVKQAYRYIK
jgi:DNA polymerase bacteriophage-type